MGFFTARKSGFVSLQQTTADAKPFDEDAAPANLFSNIDKHNSLDDDKLVSKQKVISILRCSSKKSNDDFLQSDRKNDSTDTGDTGSTASNSTTQSAADWEEKVRPVLITVARNPARKKLATDPVTNGSSKIKKVDEQYSRDILNQQEEYDSPIRHHLLRFILPDNDSNSLVDDNDMLTAYGGSITFGESTIGESTTFGESIVEESFIGESTVGESVFTLEKTNEGSTVDVSTVDGGATYMSDDYPSTTTSESAYIRNKQQWQLPKDTPRFIKNIALVLQDMVDEMSNCGAHVVRNTEDLVCGDEELKEEKWREVRKNTSTGRGRSRHR